MNKTIMAIIGLLTLLAGAALLLNTQWFRGAFFVAAIVCAIGGTFLTFALAELTTRGRSTLLWTAGSFVGAVLLYLAFVANLPPKQPGTPSHRASAVASLFFSIVPLAPLLAAVLALTLSQAGWLPGTRRPHGNGGV